MYRDKALPTNPEQSSEDKSGDDTVDRCDEEYSELTTFRLWAPFEMHIVP